jgi:putative peptidoglycan lipid II flippase
VAYGVTWALDGLGDDPALVVALLRALAVTVVDVALFLVLARLFRLTEVTDVLNTVTRRFPSRTRT